MFRHLAISGLLLLISVTLGPARALQAAEGPQKPRMVLVELFTSQGCDMCPAAEALLGTLAERDRVIVPIAFHVDYFNEPWKDVFSNSLYSQRQATYNQIYTKPKNAEYGLYYTPMMMIDGEQSINGRDAPSALAAIRRARARKPAVDIHLKLEVTKDGSAGDATIEVTSLETLAEKKPLLLCAVLREDGIVTDVRSGENAGKSLVARFPARQTKYDFIELDGKSPETQRFSFVVDPEWNRKKLRLAVFVQDKRTAVVYQANDQPWTATTSPAAPTARAVEQPQ